MARDYDPAIGAFIQPEPLGLAGDINLYRYVRNNPLTYYDPDGRQVTGQTGSPTSQGNSPVPPQPQTGPQPNPSQPNTIRQAMQGVAEYEQCVQNTSIAGGIAGACVGGWASRGSIPITVGSLFAGALAGQIIGQSFVCTPVPGSTGGKK